jgi:16S rRNA processing protein RimM
MLQLEDDLIEVGHIIGAHGVRGQVKVFSHTDPRENLLTYSPWIISQGGQQRTLEVSGKRQGKNVIASLEGISGRDQAMELTGANILIHRDQLPELEQGEYYWSQLIGLDVVTIDGEQLGQVDQMLETGANDVMVVQGERERLIPYVMDEVVKSIDLLNRRVVVDWEADF